MNNFRSGKCGVESLLKNISLVVSALAVLAVAGCSRDAKEQAGPVFYWTNRLSLSTNQYELIRLYDKLDGADAATKTELKEKIGRLTAELGTNVIRRAESRELIATRTDNVVSIFNPSHDNVAFTASIRGERRLMDPRNAGIGHDTYLPANGTLIVSNLYWTRPSVAGATNK